MKQKYKIRFFFDYGSGTCFWSGNDKTRAKFNYPIKPEELPLPVESLKKVRDLLEWYDQSLNWSYPPDPGPWRQGECNRFNHAVKQLLKTVKMELGEEFELCNEQPDLIEDPDLDQYLKDPKGFSRNK
jgi:hypothetical protein